MECAPRVSRRAVIVVDVSVSPPNSLVLIGDASGDLPDTMGDDLVSATANVVAVGTLAETDGKTQIRVIETGSSEHRPPKLVFEGVLQVPSGRLTVQSVLGEVYAERPIARGRTRVEIWVNDDREPDEVCAVLG
jgi:hypothetical protein